MSDFGDYTPADAFCADGDPDPLQVGRRIHELRQELAELAGQRIADMNDAEEELASRFAAHVIDQLTGPATDPLVVARGLHEARIELDGDPQWDDLDLDAQDLAEDLMEHVLAWLTRQGSLR